MNLKTVLLFFSLVFLFACGGNEQKQFDLESELKNLNKQVHEKLTKIHQKQVELREEIKTTKDKESCEKLLKQMLQLNEQKEKIFTDFLIAGSTIQFRSGPEPTCTEEGYK